MRQVAQVHHAARGDRGRALQETKPAFAGLAAVARDFQSLRVARPLPVCGRKNVTATLRELALQPYEPGLFTGQSSLLSMRGAWQIELLVRSAGKADTRSTFTLKVGP